MISLLLGPFLSNGQKARLANVNENVVYIGIPNHLELSIEGYPCDKAFLSTPDAKLEKSDLPCHYMFNPRIPGKLEIVLKDSTLEVIDRVMLRVRSLPDPVAVVGDPQIPDSLISGGYGIKSSTISKATLNKSTGILAYLTLHNENILFRITRYSVTVARSKKPLHTEHFETAFFPSSLRKAFKTLENNDFVIFHDIRCVGPDGRNRQLQAIALRIEADE